MVTKFYFRDMEGYKDLTEHQKKYMGKSAAFDLELLPTAALQEEMAGFIQKRIDTISMITLLNERGDYNRLCCFLEKKGKGLEHFLDWDRETWFRKLKAWMLEEGMPLNYERQGNYGNTYRMRPGVMRYVEQLLDFLEPEDDREEKEKDIWELEKLGVPFHGNLVKNYKTINFTKISQAGLREETKKGIYLNLQNEAIACISRELTAVRRLSGFLRERHPDIQSFRQLDRELLEEYLTYLKTEEGAPKKLHSELTRLRALMESIGRILEYGNLNGLFLSRDIPSMPRAEFKTYSDAELKRLNAAITRMEEQIARVMVIHQMLGTRISDTLTLQTDCLFQKDGEDLIRIRQMKTSTYIKPISRELAMLIQKAIRYTKEKYGETEYIFVSDKNPERPMQYSALQGRVIRLIYREDIRDDNGRIFGFGTHMYRHMYGVRLTEMHLDDWTIARLLGHSSLVNVKYYRKMSNQTLADETRQARHQMSLKILECLDGWEEEYEQIRQDAGGQ